MKLRSAILSTVGIVLSIGCPTFAAPVPYTDSHGDGVGSSNAARDIWSATIDNDATNLYISIYLNPAAAVSSSSNNFDYAIGITSGSGGDTSANTTTHGNPYHEDISINSSFGGMTDWLGIFALANSGGSIPGYNTYAWNSTASTWGLTQNINTAATATTAGDSYGSQTGFTGNSVINVVVPMADFTNLGLTAGSTFSFDIYSTGATAPNTAYDSLVDPVATQAGTFSNTAQFDDNSTTAPNGLDSYTVQAPEPSSLLVLGMTAISMLNRRRQK